MMEKQRNLPAWQEFLNNCDEAETKNERLWDLRPDMDTEEMFEKSEVTDFFKNRDLNPKIKLLLSNAVDELPLIQGSVLRAIFWKEMTTAEVAKNLKTTPMTIRKIKSRALKELKNKLASSKAKDVTLASRESFIISEG